MNMFGAAETSKFVDASGCFRSSQEGVQLVGPKCCCPGKDRSACLLVLRNLLAAGTSEAFYSWVCFADLFAGANLGAGSRD